jgi:hypothetical protein
LLIAFIISSFFPRVLRRQNGKSRSADAAICKSVGDQGSMTGAPGDMTETP